MAAILFISVSVVYASETQVALIGFAGAVIVALIGTAGGIFGIVWNARKQTQPLEVEAEPAVQSDDCLELLAHVTADRDFWRDLALNELGIDRRE